MDYCTLQDITNRLPVETLLQLTDDQDLGAIDEALLAATIAAAGELIDGYLRGRYALPLPAGSGILTGIAADICVYYLYGRRAEFATPERISADYKNGLKLLDNIQRGVIALGMPAPAAPVAGTSSASFTAAGRLFSRDRLRDA